MLISVYGTSTPFAYWGFSAVREVVRFLHGDDVHHVHGLSIEDFMRGLGTRQNRSVVFTSDVPDPIITSLIIQNDTPLIAFFDDLADSVAYAMDTRDYDVRDALRFSTSSFCALGYATRSRNALVFDQASMDADIRVIFTAILEHLGGATDADTVEALMGRAIAGYTPGAVTTVAGHIAQSQHAVKLPRDAFRDQSTRDQALIETVCAQYQPLFDGQAVERIAWPREVFSTSNAGREGSDLIPLIGPGRFLIFGPYLFLPIGRWIARIEFEVVDNLSGNALTLDVSKSGQVLCEAAAPLPVMGVFACELSFETMDIQTPVEVRVKLLKGAIEGKMSLKSVAIRAAPAAPVDALTADPAPRIAAEARTG